MNLYNIIKKYFCDYTYYIQILYLLLISNEAFFFM